MKMVKITKGVHAGRGQGNHMSNSSFIPRCPGNISYLKWFLVYALASLLLRGTPVIADFPLPPESPINQDAGCAGWLKGGWLKVKLQLETGQNTVFMVDTGAPITILDDSFEPQLGKQLGTMPMNFIGNRQQLAKIFAAPKLLLGGVPLETDGYVACVPLKKFKGHFQGILGMDCLQNYCLQLDFVAGKIRFLDLAETNAASWGRMYPLILSRSGPQKQFICPLIHQSGFFGDNTNLFIDTGCHLDGLVGKKESGKIMEAWVLSFFGCGRLHSGVWDGEKYSNLKVGPIDHANVLGLRFLARHLVTLDFPHQKMYLKQTTTTPLKARNDQQIKTPNFTQTFQKDGRGVFCI